MSSGPTPEPSSAPALALTTLGGWSLSATPSPGVPAQTLGPSKPLALFVYLALAPGRTARREHLLDLLWADLEPTAALHALRQTLWLLRQRCGDVLAASLGGEVRLAAAVTVDRDGFLAAVEARDWERAVALYHGEFLPGFAAPGGAEFERWADLERDRLRRVFQSVGVEQVRRLLDASRFADAVALARRVRDADPIHEGGWRILIEALCASGAVLRAAVEADALERMLREERREPEPSTRVALRLARQVSSAEALRSAVPDSAAGGPPGVTGLVTELVGREHEFSAIVRAWDGAREGAPRHVHITAPAGLGKTRLLTDAFRRLRSSGARAVLLRAHPGERLVAYAFISDLAAALGALPGAAAISPAAAAALVSLSPTLSARYPAAVPETAAGAEALRRRTIALAELVDAVADEAPLALLVDDVHWTDAASRQTLNGLAARLGAARVLLVTTTRPTPEGVVAREGTQHLVLEPLTPQHIAVLVGGLGALPAERWAADFPARLTLATHGSPLLVLETLQLLLERGLLLLTDEGWGCPDPDGVVAALGEGSALRQRLGELDREQRRLLLVLAVVGSPVASAALVAHAGRSEASLLGDLASLEQRGFLAHAGDGWAPAHDEVAEAVYAMTSPDEMRAAHLAVGQAALAEADRDTSLLVRAGQQLLQAGATDEAAGVFTRWTMFRRRHGDRRPAAALAAEFLGPAAAERDVRGLVRRLPRAVRWGLYNASRRAAALAAVLALAAGALLLLPRGSAAPPDEELIAIGRTADGRGFQALRVPLLAGQWADGRPLDAAVSGEPYSVVSAPAEWESAAVYSAARDAWAVSRLMPGSDGLDLFLVRADRSEVRLTESPGDDFDPSWSPDGSRLAFASARWSERSWTHIALLDPTTRALRPITRGDVSDARPRWSPDGSRIAFARRYPGPLRRARPSDLCRVTLEGEEPSCTRLPPGYRFVGLSKWINDTHVAAVVDSAGLRSLASVGIDDGDLTILRRNIAAGSVSPDGQWAVGIVAEAAEDAGSWVAFPLARPDESVPVRWAGKETGFILRWGRTGGRARYLSRLAIARPADRIPLGTPYQLRVRGVTVNGDTVLLPAYRWWSGDAAIASVSDSGRLDGRQRGILWVHVTAGGWRDDSVRVSITSTDPATVLREDWREWREGEWERFGAPLPRLVTGPDGVRALWSRGDGSWSSGVHSRRAYSAVDGIGVEAAFSSPITALQWQTLVLHLDAAIDSAWLAGWDHRVGGIERRLSAGGAGAVCTAVIPAGEGAEWADRMQFASGVAVGEVVLPPADTSGRWYRVRLQIFPDGRCGGAVDGRAEWISRRPIPTEEPFRVVLDGNSVGSRMLFGPVEVWQGVRGGVDWSALEPPPALRARDGKPRPGAAPRRPGP